MTLTIDGLAINHKQAGDADAVPVLMLHGWGANLDLVWPLAQHLRRYRIYALDLPGFGGSNPPPHAWDVHDYARFVLAYADAQGLDRFCLFGHSFGGRLGLVLGADHPDRVMALALADSAGIRPKTPLLRQLRQSAYKGVRDSLRAVGLKGVSERLRIWYGERYGSADFQNTSGLMRQTFVNVVNEDLRDTAARVAVPTLLLWGDQDDDTPLWQGQLLEKLIPDAGLVVLPGGHYSYLDHPAQVARAMDSLFAATLNAQ